MPRLLNIWIGDILMYDNPWIYSNQPFDGPLEGLEGFIYLITNIETGRSYVGKKHFWTRQKDRKTGRRKTKESDWRNYYSSSDDLKLDVEKLGRKKFKREILHLCKYKKEMTFWEQKEQWDRNVLLTDEYYNTNIGGKFFVRERKIYFTQYREVTTKNDSWRSIRSEQMKGDGNIAKRPDVRKKLSEKKSGENHHQYGKPISEDHQKKLHEAAWKSVKRPIVHIDGTVYESGADYRRKHQITSTGQYYKLFKDGTLRFES
jgi:hypothetical protein